MKNEEMIKTELNVALIEAIKKKKHKLVEELIIKGANPNTLDDRGVSLLYIALDNFDLESVEILMKYNIEYNEKILSNRLKITERKKTDFYVLQESCYRNCFLLAKFLVDHGADANKHSGILQNTPLSCAANAGSLPIIKYLVEHGANVNCMDGTDTTPLMIVLSCKKLNCARYLVEHGADVNAIDQNLYTPLRIAVSNDQIGIIDYLVKNGAEINPRYPNQPTPLQSAASSGKLENVKYLIEHGADINHHDADGTSALFEAAFFKELNVVEFLLDNGAELDLEKMNDRTLLEIVYGIDKSEVLNYILKVKRRMKMNNILRNINKSAPASIK